MASVKWNINDITTNINFNGNDDEHRAILFLSLSLT